MWLRARQTLSVLFWIRLRNCICSEITIVHVFTEEECCLVLLQTSSCISHQCVKQNSNFLAFPYIPTRSENVPYHVTACSTWRLGNGVHNVGSGTKIPVEGDILFPTSSRPVLGSTQHLTYNYLRGNLCLTVTRQGASRCSFVSV
jgi:hypothetical protein